MREEIEEVEVETSKGTAFVSLTQLPGMQAGKLLVRLTGVIGPGVSGLAVAMKSKDGAQASKAAEVLAQRLSEDEFERITLQLLRGARARVPGQEEFIDLNKQTLDSLFEGCSEGLFRLVFAALKGNYASFFSVAESQIKTALATLTAKEKSLNTPTQTPVYSGPAND